MVGGAPETVKTWYPFEVPLVLWSRNDYGSGGRVGWKGRALACP